MNSTIAEVRKPNASWIIWAGVSFFSIALLGFIVSAPVAEASGHPQFAAAIYRAFSYVCHQLPERSFHLDGHQFAVCSRCTGLYSGFALAAACYPLTRSLSNTGTPSRLWLLLAVAPLVIDFSLSYFGIWQNTHLTRFITGALLGAGTVSYIMPGLIQLSQMIRKRAAGD